MGFGKFRLDSGKKVLWYEDEVCDLPIKAIELLSVLIADNGEVVTKERILEEVWDSSFVEESVIPQNIFFLRKLFKHYETGEDLIQTVPRRGYRFSGEITTEFDEETIIEREVYERKLIAETDLSVDELREVFARAAPAGLSELDVGRANNASAAFKGTRKAGWIKVFAVSAVSAVAVVFFGWFLFFSSAEGKKAARTFPAGGFKLKYEMISDSGRVLAVGLSPDDQHAAYTVNTPDGKYKMILEHLPTGSETVVLKDRSDALANITFSPDGNYIYYIGNDAGGRLTAFRMPLYGGVSTPVLHDFTHLFSISPDGEWLAFIRRDPEIPAHYLEIARSRDGSERRTIARISGDQYLSIWGTAPAWSPDGKKILAAAFIKSANKKEPSQSRLFEFEISSGRKTIIKTPERWHRIHEPYYSSNGKSIFAKVRDQIGEPMQIWQLDVESGRARNLTNDTNDYREFRVSSDESFLVTAIWEKSENLFLVPTSNPGDLKQLTFDRQGNNGAEGLAWTPDGKYLVYTKTKGFGIGNLWMINVETGESKQITKEERAEQGKIIVTPDGRSLIYASNAGGSFQIWRMDFDGTNRRQLTDGTSVAFSGVSTDGKWIYYAESGLWRIPAEGGAAEKVMEGDPLEIQFSPVDQQKFSAYFNDPNETAANSWKQVLFDLGDLKSYKDLDLRQSGGRIGWKPDGKLIYFIGAGENFNNIFTVSPETLEKQQLTFFQDQRISKASLSPDGKTIALSRGMATGNIVKITVF
ncbi:MAG: winged helix-turn-helix domain-containing protein [Pyrinomonadaceae bacterium]